MKSILRGKHFISTQEWSKEEIDTVIDTSFYLKRLFALSQSHRFLQDKTIFMMFFEQSTRTRNSIEAGITQLGGHAHDLTPDKMQISHGENAKDTANVLSRYGHAIAIRNCFLNIGNKYIREVAKHSSVPIISMQDDIYHPLQVLADLMTIKEKFTDGLKGLKVTISWAYTKSYRKPLSVPQSQILLFTRYGLDVTLAYPEEFSLMPDIVKQAKDNAKQSGGKFNIVHDMSEGVKGADIVIAKNWGGFLGKEPKKDKDGNWIVLSDNEIDANLNKYKDWIYDENKLALTNKNSIYMHALPADRGREVADAVIDSEHSVVYDEAENRLHTAKAIMALTMGGRI